MLIVIYIVVARDPKLSTRLLCNDMGILNFFDDVRGGVMILEVGKGRRKGVAKYFDIVVVSFGSNSVFNSFKNFQSFQGLYYAFFWEFPLNCHLIQTNSIDN